MSCPVPKRQCPRKINLLHPIDVSLSHTYFTILLNVLLGIINEWASDTSSYVKVHKCSIHYPGTWGDVNYVPCATFICNYVFKEGNGGRLVLVSFEELWRWFHVQLLYKLIWLQDLMKMINTKILKVDFYTCSHKCSLLYSVFQYPCWKPCKILLNYEILKIFFVNGCASSEAAPIYKEL